MNLCIFTFSLSHIMVSIVQIIISFIVSFLKKILTLFCKRGKKHWMQLLFFVFCEYLCVDECISYMFMWAYGHVHSSINSYVWRPETDIGCCSFSPFTLLSETQPRACRWVWDGSWWMNSGFSSVSVTPVRVLNFYVFFGVLYSDSPTCSIWSWLSLNALNYLDKTACFLWYTN